MNLKFVPLTLAMTLAFTSLLAATVASAADSDRGGRWEATFQILGSSSESSNGENGSSLDLDSDTGWGFGFTYNFNQHLAVGFDAAFLSPDYTAVVVPDGGGTVTVDHEADIFNGAVNGTWNILPGNFTPYIQAGIGWTYVDSNVVDGLPSTGCWWDPWWGYVCANFYDTYEDTRFSWNGGVGVRLEFQNDFFLKGSYNKVWVDGGQNSSDPDFDMWRIELGWMFY
ncbi:MAG: porin family protein [Pseudomonadales bacterium]